MRHIQGAYVVILDDADRVLILLRPSWIAWGANQWAFPGGTLEKGESPEEGASREVEEETTLQVTNLRPVMGIPADKIVPFYTRDYSGEVKIDWEHDDWRWATPDTISNYDIAPNVKEAYEWVLKHGC